MPRSQAINPALGPRPLQSEPTMMAKFLVLVLLLLVVSAEAKGEHSLLKRVLPINQNCDPQKEVCRKGDWIATKIADCRYTGYFTCDAQNDITYSWIVDVA